MEEEFLQNTIQSLTANRKGKNKTQHFLRGYKILDSLSFIIILRFMIHVKVVIVGDGSIGKTCIMVRFTQRQYSAEYTPTVFDNRVQDIAVSNQLVTLNLWDTAGQEAYSRLRSVAYPNTDVFLLAFSVVNPETFVNAKKTWVPEIKREVPTAKIIFVGTKIDLRDSIKATQNSNQKPLQKAELQQHIRKQFNAPYLQCSALLDLGVNQIFQQAARMILIDRGVIPNENRRSISKPRKEEGFKEQKYCGGCSVM